MYISTVEDTSRFSTTIFTYMTYSIACKTDFDLGYIWRDLITITAEEDVFREDLPSKF